MPDLDALTQQVEALTMELGRLRDVVKRQDTHHGRPNTYLGNGVDAVELFFQAYLTDLENGIYPPSLRVDPSLSTRDDMRLQWSPDGSTFHEVFNSGQAPIDAIAWITEQTPTGTIDAANDTFTIARAPTICLLYKNHTFQRPGGNDYTLAGTTITYETHAIPKDAQYAGDTDDWHHAVLIG